MHIITVLHVIHTCVEFNKPDLQTRINPCQECQILDTVKDTRKEKKREENFKGNIVGGRRKRIKNGKKMLVINNLHVHVV